MSTAERIAAFRGMSDDGRRLVDSGAAVRRLVAGRTIITKGQAVSGAYFVLDGRLRVYTLLPGGREATLYFLGPGETCVLALNSLFNDLRYPAWVATETATTVAVLPGSVYGALFATEQTVRDLTVRTLSTLVFRLMDELDHVHASTVEQRLAGFLLVRASGSGEIHHTQQEIAGHIGTTREMVARLVGRMVRRGWIATGRGRIAVLRPAALAALAQDEPPGDHPRPASATRSPKPRCKPAPCPA
ncbi:Crp/Fnr family transcriptional regulator [Rhodoplanes azumiensis]|uniref:Crp/Fnr family transcriptional regulator n=1 Tax=Rhodoplanes azumiensis TaxID=1897628 RepID=A0ABW5ACL2_9BRAD